MKILFVHQNFPAQFKHLAPALVNQGHHVTALTMNKNVSEVWQGVRVIRYRVSRKPTADVHPWVVDFESKTIRAEATFQTALQLKKEGYTPDIIIAHPGWGESLFLKKVWPRAKMGIYCEYYYRSKGADYGFDPEFPPYDPSDLCRLQLKNTSNLQHFEIVEAGISPTRWQADCFPDTFRQRISVIHDGINTEGIRPNAQVRVTLNNNLTLDRNSEVITFVNRNLEPYRGYHRFMRALPHILLRHPNAQVIIIGGDSVSYGTPPPAGTTWAEIFFNEVKHQLDLSRVHFLGRISYEQYLCILQLSTVHVYFTYPFVLSWSLLEAMSAGCAIVASDTAPVREVIHHNETGQMVDFFDQDGLVRTVCDLLEAPEVRLKLGCNARTFVQENYDVETVCLPQQLAWVETLAPS